MGYRSDVSLTIYKNDFFKLIEKAKRESKGALELINYAELFEAEEVYTLYWTSVKWYEGYSDVDFIESFIDSGIQYSYKRIGEDYSDIEERCNDDTWGLSDYTYIERVIDLSECGLAEDIKHYTSQKSPSENEADIEDVSQSDFNDILDA